MLDIGIQELLVIMVLALIVFGPDKLPELGRRLGRAMREFRRASDEFRRTVETNLNLNLDDHSPLPASADTGGDAGSAETPSVASEGGAATEAVIGEAATGVLPAEARPHVNGDGPGLEPIEPFWMTRGGRLVHRAGCGWEGRIHSAERVGFKSATEAWNQGLLACPVCDPRPAQVAS